MLCTVTRTHCLGEKRPDRDPGPAITGTVRMYSIMREDMKRYIRVMTMDGLKTFGATQKAEIPDLIQPELLTFASDRGMMVCGFEEINGKRYYQGWWMQWIGK
jgi:polynucleotide 5'-kinase involved in rRNA processing